MKRLEYLTLALPEFSRAGRLAELGLEGWRLCAIGSNAAYFARDLDARLLAEQADAHAAERGGR